MNLPAQLTDVRTRAALGAEFCPLNNISVDSAGKVTATGQRGDDSVRGNFADSVIDAIDSRDPAKTEFNLTSAPTVPGPVEPF